MRDQSVFRLNRQALIAAIISAAFPIASQAAAGRVEFSIGSVTASGADGSERSLAKGGEINNGDTIVTSDGRVQIKFTDGGYMSLQPNTQFKVDDYAYEGKADGSEKGFFKLIKGGLRAITGAIGHTNKTAYRINTPVATIGIRGTELTGEYNEDGDNKKLIVHVIGGAVYIENEAGDLILYKGQSGVVTDENKKPGYTDEESLIVAAGPDGGQPEEDNEQQQQQEQQSLVFQQAEQYTNNGIPDDIVVPLIDELVDTNPTLTAIASYAAANAEGVYTLDISPGAVITGIPNTAPDQNGLTNIHLSDGIIWANFQPGTVKAMITVSADAVSGATGLYETFYSLSGTQAGVGFNLGNAMDTGGSLCSYSSCSFTATGLFFGPTAQKAGINYTVSNTDFGNINNGQAGFHAPNVPTPLPPPY